MRRRLGRCAGGSYFLKDELGTTVAVFKPLDEEPMAPSNPRTLRLASSAPPALSAGPFTRSPEARSAARGGRCARGGSPSALQPGPQADGLGTFAPPPQRAPAHAAMCSSLSFALLGPYVRAPFNKSLLRPDMPFHLCALNMLASWW